MRAVTALFGFGLLFAVAGNNPSNAYNSYYPPDLTGEQKYHWKYLGERELDEALRKPAHWNNAKNVIIFVGTGMDPNTVTATRIYQQKEGGRLIFEEFPNIGLLKTYSVNKKVPDSAAAATALFTGVKTNNAVIGVDASVTPEVCLESTYSNTRVSSIMQWAQESGKETGFITNKRVTSTTPSALYAHSASRYWECDASIPKNGMMCKDIGRQLVEDEPGRNFKVIFGGGRQVLMRNPPYSPVDNIDIFTCTREEEINLIEQWKKDKIFRRAQFQYIQNTGDLLNLETSSTDYVLGIFANSHLPYEAYRNTSINGQPSLEMMVQPALKILKKGRNGFVLMVENGLIDTAHHDGHARLAIEETMELDKTIRKTVELLNDWGIINDTLIIVTGSLGHTMSINGYPDRGESILGVAAVSKHDDVPYTILTYATGTKNSFQYSQSNSHVTRDNPSGKDTTSRDYAQQAAILTDKETHGGQDITVYAQGPMAHLFHAVHEESYVAWVIAYAAKIGPYRTGAAVALVPSFLGLFSLFIIPLIA